MVNKKTKNKTAAKSLQPPQRSPADHCSSGLHQSHPNLTHLHAVVRSDPTFVMLASATMRQQQWMATRAAAAAASGRLLLCSAAPSQQRSGVALVRITSGCVATSARAWGPIRPLCVLAAGESRSRLPATATSPSALQPLPSPSHRSFANLPPARPSTSSPRTAAGRSASAGATAAGAGPASFTATVAPPRLVFELQPPNSVRTKTLLNSVQALFWVGIYGAHFAVPELVPLWYGALGLTTSLAFGVAMHFRAVRTINELAIVRPHLGRDLSDERAAREQGHAHRKCRVQTAHPNAPSAF